MCLRRGQIEEFGEGEGGVQVTVVLFFCDGLGENEERREKRK